MESLGGAELNVPSKAGKVESVSEYLEYFLSITKADVLTKMLMEKEGLFIILMS